MSKITFMWDIDGFADQTMRVVLDSKTYEMRFQWNERDESWLVYFGDVGSTPTISFKLTTIFDIFEPFKYLENIPSGQLSVFSFKQSTKRVGRYNIGFLADLQLLYSSPDEELTGKE